MLIEEEKLKDFEDDLKWVSLKEKSFFDKLKSKGIFAVLVPLGCLTTTGILMGGIYNLYHHNSPKQQLFMRYRVLAQGITLGISVIGIYSVSK